MSGERQEPDRVEQIEGPLAIAIILSLHDQQNLAYLLGELHRDPEINLKTEKGRRRVADIVSRALEIAAWVSAGEVSYG